MRLKVIGDTEDGSHGSRQRATKAGDTPLGDRSLPLKELCERLETAVTGLRAAFGVPTESVAATELGQSRLVGMVWLFVVKDVMMLYAAMADGVSQLVERCFAPDTGKVEAERAALVYSKCCDAVEVMGEFSSFMNTTVGADTLPDVSPLPRSLLARMRDHAESLQLRRGSEGAKQVVAARAAEPFAAAASDAADAFSAAFAAPPVAAVSDADAFAAAFGAKTAVAAPAPQHDASDAFAAAFGAMTTPVAVPRAGNPTIAALRGAGGGATPELMGSQTPPDPNTKSFGTQFGSAKAAPFDPFVGEANSARATLDQFLTM